MSVVGIMLGVLPVFRFSPTITSATGYNVRAAAVAAGWPTSIALSAVITVTGIVNASAVTAYALAIDGSYPIGSSIQLNIAAGGYIVGKGGKGGDETTNSFTANPGTSGGPSLLIAAGTGASITITNNGIIGGGGGGGAGGMSVNDESFMLNTSGAGGGGGGYGVRGSTNGVAGTLTNGGAGGNVQAGSAGPGASGGNLGLVGGSTEAGYWGGSPGGAPGAATTGQANATWVVTGTRLGAVN